MKKFMSLVLAAAMAMSLAACGASADTSEPAADNAGAAADAATDAGADAGDAAADAGAVTLHVGGIGPLTGNVAVYGLATYQGAQIAVDEINALGGIQLDLDFKDDTGVAETAINAYNTLKDWADVIYGTTTTDPCINVANETFNDRFFQVTPSASSTKVTEGRDNVFQMCFTDPNQGTAAADYVKDHSLGENIGIIYNNADAYSTGLRDAFTARAAEIGLNIVEEQAFADDNNADFSAQINALAAANVDLLFMPIYYTPAYNIVSAAKAQGFAPKYFGCDGMDGILDIEGMDPSLVEGLMLMTPFNASATDDTTVSFVEKYQAAYDSLPNQFAADGYDAMYALYYAATKAGITNEMSHEEICDALIATFTGSDFSVDGLTGSGMTWSTVGEISKDPVAVRIENGVYVTM